MEYNFDEIIDRKGTGCIKHDCAVKRGVPEDVLSLWVADMDFRVPREVEEALIERCRHGIFGYTEPDDKYLNTVLEWFGSRYGLKAEKNHIVNTPGVVFAINMAIQAYTEKGDGVLIQQPVYYPFFKSILNNERRVVNNALVNIDGKYQIDFEDFEKKIVEEKPKMFILCSPHNPIGRVWNKEELLRMGDICRKYGVLIISDEIHCDIVYKPNIHIPIVTLREEYKDLIVTCTAPSKTFNLAGFQTSNIIIQDRKLRRKFTHAINCAGYSEIPVLGMTACQAAYQHGRRWLEELTEYLQGNIDYIRTYLQENLPKVKLIEPEGTYLLWLDFREYGYSASELDHKITFEAKLWLDGGTMFGEEGAGYQRINITSSRIIIQAAMESLKRVFG